MEIIGTLAAHCQAGVFKSLKQRGAKEYKGKQLFKVRVWLNQKSRPFKSRPDN